MFNTADFLLQTLNKEMDDFFQILCPNYKVFTGNKVSDLRKIN